MSREMKVADVMTSDVITVTPDSDILSAIEIMAEKRIGALAVVNADGTFAGMIEDDDIIIEEARVHEPVYIDMLLAIVRVPGTGARLERELRKIGAVTVEDAMKTGVRVLSPENTLEDVATLMVDERMYRLAVVENERVVGIVTRGDLVRALAKESVQSRDAEDGEN